MLTATHHIATTFTQSLKCRGLLKGSNRDRNVILKPAFILCRKESLARGVAHIWPHLPPRYAASTLTSTHQYSHLPPWYALCTHRLPRGSTILPLPPPPAQVSPRQQPCYPDEGSVALIIISSMASTTSSLCTCVPPLETLEPNLNLAPIFFTANHFRRFNIQTLAHISS